MKLEIVTYPDPRLRLKSEPVGEITSELRALAKDMADTMYAADGIGLAAPQVGRNIRLIVVDVRQPEKYPGPQTLVNPVVEPLTDEIAETEEGCLSVCELRSVVRRPAKVRVTATDLEGAPVCFEAEGLMAVCLQHECDHLDGKLFIDYLSRLKRSLYENKVKKKLRQETK